MLSVGIRRVVVSEFSRGTTHVLVPTSSQVSSSSFLVPSHEPIGSNVGPHDKLHEVHRELCAQRDDRCARRDLVREFVCATNRRVHRAGQELGNACGGNVARFDRSAFAAALRQSPNRYGLSTTPGRISSSQRTHKGYEVCQVGHSAVKLTKFRASAVSCSGSPTSRFHMKKTGDTRNLQIRGSSNESSHPKDGTCV